jgi:hypothetical protein
MAVKQMYFLSIEMFNTVSILFYILWQIDFVRIVYLFTTYISSGPSLWSSDQSSWLRIQGSRVRFQVLPDFLKSSGSGVCLSYISSCNFHQLILGYNSWRILVGWNILRVALQTKIIVICTCFAFVLYSVEHHLI